MRWFCDSFNIAEQSVSSDVMWHDSWSLAVDETLLSRNEPIYDRKIKIIEIQITKNTNHKNINRVTWQREKCIWHIYIQWRSHVYIQSLQCTTIKNKSCNMETQTDEVHALHSSASHLLSVPWHNLSFGSPDFHNNLCTKNMEFLTSSHSAISNTLFI